MTKDEIMRLADAYAATKADVAELEMVWTHSRTEAKYKREEVDEARAALEAAVLVQGEPDQRFINLLCRIHRDGGHYIAEHGLDRAAADADVLVAELFAMCGDPPAPEAKQEPDWKRLYEIEKKSKQAIYDKYERDIAKLPRVVPMDTHPAPVNQALLEACKKLIAFVDDTPEARRWDVWLRRVSAVRAAIAAAEGKV